MQIRNLLVHKPTKIALSGIYMTTNFESQIFKHIASTKHTLTSYINIYVSKQEIIWINIVKSPKCDQYRNINWTLWKLYTLSLVSWN